MMSFLRVAWIVMEKDLRVEFRTRERIAAMAAFTVLTGLLFYYALDQSVVDVKAASSGLIWMTIIFSGLLGIGRSFQLEEEDGAFQGLLSAPIPLSALYIGKVGANLVLSLVMAALAVFIFGLFFRLDFSDGLVGVGMIISLSLVGFSALGTLFSALAIRSSMGTTLLPILLFPLLVPMVVFGVTATTRIFAGRPPEDIESSIRLLLAFALVGLFGGASLFRFVVEE